MKNEATREPVNAIDRQNPRRFALAVCRQVTGVVISKYRLLL